MTVSVFDLFKVGIGPSSSHTVGPMLAACRFAERVQAQQNQAVASVQVTLWGALSLTGKGHATDKAVVLGLSGCRPDQVMPDQADLLWQTVRTTGRLTLSGKTEISFDCDHHIIFRDEFLPEHPNGMTLETYGSEGELLEQQIWFSLGGGFIATREQLTSADSQPQEAALPYEFSSAGQLLSLCEDNHLTPAQLMLANEQARGLTAEQVQTQLQNIVEVMQCSVERGCQSDGELPGGLNIVRRAPELYRRWHNQQAGAGVQDPLLLMDLASLSAIAVNEENACGGRIVTAPTNGAAGVIPGVLSFYRHYNPGADMARFCELLLTAAAIGALYKRNASISAAEVGCQGEIGVASSMAAAGLAAVWGGSVAQMENAAEIAMEHHLGMTCDPVAGLVQVPCIERNAMGVVKAINAARLALAGDGRHKVSLDQVIATMYQTGKDMNRCYKETSTGGLAVNVVYC